MGYGRRDKDRKGFVYKSEKIRVRFRFNVVMCCWIYEYVCMDVVLVVESLKDVLKDE